MSLDKELDQNFREVQATIAPEFSDLSKLSIASLARVIRRDWARKGKGVNFAAKPYLDAMASMESASDNYGADDGKSIILYFLSNASSWRGDVAKQVKAELKRRIA